MALRERSLLRCALFCLVLSAAAPGAASRSVILATTTSVQDSGLLDVLVPRFERKTAYRVRAIAAGTGQALELTARGEADVALVHAPALEKKYVAEGKLRNRRLVMYNDFVLLGPKADPAGVGLAKSAAEALRRIAARGASFVSRGDGSGTHQLELSLWRELGIQPAASWYVESGQGMGATLVIASERNGYTISDRATYLAFRRRLSLALLFERDPRLVNLYSVLEANPERNPRVNGAGGKSLADFLVSAEAQAVIGGFGTEKFGQPLFFPAAGEREEEIGR